MNDDELLDALGDALAPPDRPVPVGGLAAVRAQSGGAAGPPGDRTPSRRTVLVGSVAAAIGAAAGVAGTVAATSRGAGDGDGDGGDPSGEGTAAPPTRPVEFRDVPTGISVEGRTIDHTWGMELLLDIDGLPPDRDYGVRYATGDGSRPVSAGGFRSVAVPMACRFNGTALRDDVIEIVVVDQSTGRVVVRGRPA